MPTAAWSRATRPRGKHSEPGAASVDMLDRHGGYSIEKANELLGWQPKVDLQEGLRLCVEWGKSKGLAVAGRRAGC